MSHSGTIKLFDRYDGIVQCKKYHTVKERKGLISGWKEIYGKRFDECYINIAPNISDNTNEDGTNKWNHPLINKNNSRSGRESKTLT